MISFPSCKNQDMVQTRISLCPCPAPGIHRELRFPPTAGADGRPGFLGKFPFFGSSVGLGASGQALGLGGLFLVASILVSVGQYGV